MADKYVEKIKSASTGVIYTVRDQNTASKQDLLVSGENIKTINNQSILGSGNIDVGGGSGTSDYEQLTNKPSINDVTLTGDKSLSDLGIASAGDLAGKADKATTLAGYGITDAASASDLAAKADASALTNHTTDTTVHVTAADKTTWSGKQDKLTSANAGSNVTITEESGVVKINATGGGSGTSDYSALTNKPSINTVTLSGDKSSADLGLLGANQGSENSGKVLGIDNTGAVVPVTVSTAENTVTTGTLEDMDDALEFADESGNIALKITNTGEVKTVAFDSTRVPDGYERFYPLTQDGYYNASGAVVAGDGGDYLYTQIFVNDLQGETIYINNDPNETYCMFKNASGIVISSWNTAKRAVVVPINAHSLCLSNYLYGNALDFYIVRPVRKTPIGKGMINYVDFTRPNDIVWQDISGGKVTGTLTEGTGLVLTTGTANRVIANKVCVLNTFAFGADIVLPEPTAVEEGGVTTYTYTGRVCLGSDVTGYGTNHGSCVSFDFANKTITAYGDGNGMNHTSTAAATANITNALADGCTNFQIRIERVEGIMNCTITCTDSGKSDTLQVGYKSGTTYGQGGCLYDRPHFYSVSGATVWKNFWVSAAYNPQCIMCGDSITQGSQNTLANVWSYKFATYLGNNAISAGRGSGKINNALNSIATLVPALRPKSLIVAIGTNGTQVPSDARRYEYMKLICEHYGVFFVACTPWANTNRANNVDPRAAYIRSLNGQYADLNRLTKAGFKVDGAQVMSYFTSDGTHLSVSGNTLTYDYLVAKFGWLKKI